MKQAVSVVSSEKVFPDLRESGAAFSAGGTGQKCPKMHGYQKVTVDMARNVGGYLSTWCPPQTEAKILQFGKVGFEFLCQL